MLSAGASPGNGVVTMSWSRHAPRRRRPPTSSSAATPTTRAGPRSTAGPPSRGRRPPARRCRRARGRSACASTTRRFSADWSDASDPVVVDRTAPAAPAIATDRAADASPDWFRDSVTLTFAGNGDPALPDGSPGSGVDPASLPAAATRSVAGTYTATRHRPRPRGQHVGGRVAHGPRRHERAHRLDRLPGGRRDPGLERDRRVDGERHRRRPRDARERLGRPGHRRDRDVHRERARGPRPRRPRRARRVVLLPRHLRLERLPRPGVERRRQPDGRRRRRPDHVHAERRPRAGRAGRRADRHAPARCSGKKSTVDWTLPSTWTGLRYIAGTYVWAFRTQAAWRNDCRELTVALDDGTTHTATFRFK